MQTITQNSFSFAPEVTPASIRTWTSLKRKYGRVLILLLQGNEYYSIGIDAIVLHELTGLRIFKRPAIYCSFERDILGEVILQLTALPYTVAVCDHPKNELEHFFT